MRATYAPETGMQISGFRQAQDQELITKTVSLKYCLKEQTAENTKIGI